MAKLLDGCNTSETSHRCSAQAAVTAERHKETNWVPHTSTTTCTTTVFSKFLVSRFSQILHATCSIPLRHTACDGLQTDGMILLRVLSSTLTGKFGKAALRWHADFCCV